MKIQELRQLSAKKLQEELQKTERELTMTRFHTRTGLNQDTAKVAKLRKMVAQIKTLQKESSLSVSS